jgi:hypothetical protein
VYENERNEKKRKAALYRGYALFHPLCVLVFVVVVVVLHCSPGDEVHFIFFACSLQGK